MRQRAAASELCHRCDRRRSGFAMIDDMPRLKEAMEQMDAEDPAVAQAAKDRAAQTLSDAKLSFSKMAELIEQRRLLLRPRIVANIKRMDQPGTLGDAAFRDAGSALRREGQSFRQIAEAIERTDRPAPHYGDPMDPMQTSAPLRQMPSEPLRQMPGEPGPPAWLRALALVASIVFFPLLHPIRFLAIALLALFLFYSLRGYVPSGQQALGYFDGVAAVRDSTGKAMSSVSSFVNEYILRQSKEAKPTPPAPIPSPPAAAQSPPSLIPSAPPATAPAAPAPSANPPAALAPPSAAPAPPLEAPAGPPVSTPRRDVRGAPPSRSAANRGAAREDRDPLSRAPFEDDRPRIEDDRPRTFEDIIPEGIIPEGIRRRSRTAGPCVGGVGGCAWGGGRY